MMYYLGQGDRGTVVLVIDFTKEPDTHEGWHDPKKESRKVIHYLFQVSKVKVVR
jgi:hypothetical protein